MAVPTANELYEFLTKFTSEHPENLWSLGTLVDAARKHFNSTTPAIEKRIKPLLGTWKNLRPVRVNYTGLVFWGNDRVDSVTTSAYYLELQRRGAWDRVEYGPIVLDGDKTRANLWANGVRIFYMLDTDHARVMARIIAHDEEKKAERKAARYQEKLEIKAALEKAAPQGDGLDLLNGLAKLFSHPTRVHTYMHTSMSRPEDPAELHITVSIDHSNLAAFLEVLRNGVPKAEQAAAVVELPAQRAGGES